jgi:putative chitinase
VITEEKIIALFPRASSDHVSEFYAQSEEIFSRFDLSRRPIRLHFFMAQIGHESGGLTLVQENLNYTTERLCAVWPNRFPDLEAAKHCSNNPENLANTVYCGRMGNGPFETGDGWQYRGRGYIQLTGRDAYRHVGEIAGLDLEKSPDLASSPAHALRVACSFWRWKNLNEICDTGDFVKVTRRINGGTNGMADRNAWLDKVHRLLAAPVEISSQPAADKVIAIQRALQKKGYREVGAADGLIGPRTSAAITRYRQTNGLGPGAIDAELEKSLGIAS